VAYQSNESGGNEIWVQSFPNPSISRIPISTTGGTSPRWSGDGSELFYLRSGIMMAVKLRITGSTLEPAAPTALFELPSLGSGGALVSRHPYDVTPDGQRFIFSAIDSEGPTDTPLTVVVNWAASFRK